VNLFTDSQAQNIDGLGGIAGGFGGTWPAKIWDTFMTTQFANLPVAQLPTPDYTGYSKWNQVGNLPKKAKKNPHPNPTPTNPFPQPSCTPGEHGHKCPHGGGPTPNPTASPTPTSPSPSSSPSPSCSMFCPSATPSTSSGAALNLATFDAARQPAEEARQRPRAGPGSVLVRAVTAVLAGLF
jgi:hypothetical protein